MKHLENISLTCLAIAIFSLLYGIGFAYYSVPCYKYILDFSGVFWAAFLITFKIFTLKRKQATEY